MHLLPHSTSISQPPSLRSFSISPQVAELEWELEVFPLLGLVLGAFLAMVFPDLASEVSLEASLELAFPVSPSSIWGNWEKA